MVRWYIWFDTCRALTPFSGLTDPELEHLHVTPQERNDLMDEVTTEISVYFGMLYHLVEIFKGHDDFADELSGLIRIYQRKVLIL